MSDLEHLSNEYLLLQERFDRIKLEPPPSDSDFLDALMELADAAQKLKVATAQIADRKARSQTRALIDETINPNEHKKTVKAQHTPLLR